MGKQYLHITWSLFGDGARKFLLNMVQFNKVHIGEVQNKSA